MSSYSVATLSLLGSTSLRLVLFHNLPTMAPTLDGMTSRSFAAATVLRQGDEADLVWDVPDGWQQGRGAWGGLVAGAVARAVDAGEGDSERVLRTLSLHLAAPLPVGPARVQVTALRRGSSMSTWQVVVSDIDGQACAHAVAITGTARAPDLAEQSRGWGSAAPPTLPGVETVPALPKDAPGMPVFLRHLEVRAVGGVPFSGASARCAGYVRFEEQGVWDVPQLVAMVDAWWPTALPALTQLRPVATVTYAAHVLIDPAAIPPGQPLAYEASMAGTLDGFTTETRRLWTLDGRLAVENHQSIVVIR